MTKACLSSTLHKIPFLPASFLFCPPAYALHVLQSPRFPPFSHHAFTFMTPSRPPSFSPKLPPRQKQNARGIPLPQHAPQKHPEAPISLNTLLSLPHSRSPLQHTHLACAPSSLPFPNKFAYSCPASLHPQLPYTPPPPSHALLFFLLCSFPLARASLPFLHAVLLLLFPKSLIFILQHAFISLHWITRCPSIALSPPQ